MIRALRRRLAAVGGERGSVTLELAIIAPALLLVLGALILAGRVQVSAGAVEQASRSAARDASLARTPDDARTAAVQAAERELAAAGVTCSSTGVEVDVTGFRAPLGQDAVVRVRVECSVSMDDLAIPGLPVSRTLSAEGVSPLDRYRSR